MTMKKTYLAPETLVAHVELNNSLLGSSMVQNEGSLGNEFNGEDVSYVRRENEWDVWTNEEGNAAYYDEYYDYEDEY